MTAVEGSLADRRASRATRLWRRHRVAATTAILAMVGVAAVVVPPLLDSPHQEHTEEIDGRTWLGIQRSGGPTVVLVNGISGLVEASARSGAPFAGIARFVGSNAQFTLMRTASTAVLVADGSHVADETALPDDAQPALAATHVVLAGNAVSVRSITADGRLDPPVPVPDVGNPIDGAGPTVDRSGSAWLLRDIGGTRRALRIGPTGRVDRTLAVPSDAARLVAVDGTVVPVTADDGRPPDVAVETDGTFASAVGATISIRTGNGTTSATAPAAVTHLAVWHGSVWATTTSGLFLVEGDQVTSMAAIASISDVFTDGGRMWAVSGSTAAAVDRQQRVTLFRLASVDLNLCPGSCTAADAVEFIEKRNSTTSSSTPSVSTTSLPEDASPLPSLPTTTTTAPLLTLPPVEPELATTTTTQPRNGNGSSSTTPTSVTPSIPPTLFPPTSTVPAGTTPGPGTNVGPPPSTAPEPPSSTTQPSVPPTLPPHGGSLTLYVEGGSNQFSGDLRIGLGFNGSAEMCENNTAENNVNGINTTAGLSWSGSAGSGERYTSIKFSGGGAYGFEDVTVSAGQATFSLYLCGLTTSVTVNVTDSHPHLGPIEVAGTVEVGQTVTARANYTFGPGWTAHPSWTFGPCGAEAPIDSTDGATRTTANLTFAQTGQHCVFLTVSFTHDAEDPVSQGGSAQIDAQPPATAPPPTDPPPTNPPATSPPPTTPGATNPPATNPPATNPPVTIPPTTTTTAPPSTDPPTTTTSPPTTTTPPG